MQKQNSEIRIIWLMVLIITAIATWFLNYSIVTFLCAIAFVISVMQFVDTIEKPAVDIAKKTQTSFQSTSKVPLYLSSLAALVGTAMEWHWVVGAAVSIWIFFFLKWLRKLEGNLRTIQQKIAMNPQALHQASLQTENQIENQSEIQASQFSTSEAQDLGFIDQIKHWLFKGNPVLKVAILVLVVGIILLLRFATEHWQLSLALKLGLVALSSVAVTSAGLLLINKNRSFALALEGLGMAGLFLTLFFAYYNLVISTFTLAVVCYVVVMGVTLYLSLKQQALELALMAMVIAYLAPFTLPVRDITAIELLAYYLVINIAVAFLSTLRPWKILNQIAFLMTMIVGGLYAFLKGYSTDRYQMTALVLAHASVFIWLSYRYSQLIAKKDFEQFRLKPILDLGLIFGAPIIAYIFIYLMHFQDKLWQAGISLGFAVIYALLYMLAKRNQLIAIISQSYLSLALIFVALIPPILLTGEWSVIGWSIEGLLIYIYALYRSSNISRYLAMGLLSVAGLSALYFWVDLSEFPRVMFWILSLSYLAVVLVSNAVDQFRKQLSLASTLFLSALNLFASIMLLILCLDLFDGPNQWIQSLLVVSVILTLSNELLNKAGARWTWLLPKWSGLVVLAIFSTLVLIQNSQNGLILWDSAFNRFGFLVASLLNVALWLRPLNGVKTEKEWVSLGTLISFALASLTLIPQMPFISVVILPLVFAIWCYLKKGQADWQIFWQSRSSLLLMLTWIVCSQLFSQQAFDGYYLPIFNPFDMVSLAILLGFIWLLSLQLKTGLDRGIVAVLLVLSLLWLSSYILLRALHVYFATPYNDMALWGNAVVQLSLTMLWVGLAFISMSFASRKQLRAVWLLGGSILVIVTLKLVLLDLSHVGTLTRVISFLGAGMVMLVIAYIAPIPENEKTLI